MLDYLFRFHWDTVDVSAAFLVYVCSEDYSHLSMIKLESVLQEVNVDALAHDQFLLKCSTRHS